MLLKSKHLQPSQINLSTLKTLKSLLLHQIYIQAKAKDKKILTTLKCALGSSKAPTPQDLLRNLKAIKSLGTSLGCVGS